MKVNSPPATLARTIGRWQIALMGYLWRIPLALFGLLLVRGLIYPRGWGRRTLLVLLLGVLGLELTVPLITYSRTGLIITLAVGLTVLMPYHQLAVRYLKARTRAGLRAIAGRWGTELSEDPRSGLWQVTKQASGNKAWVGNVLTHMRSIHPGVKKSQARYMLAFVVELRSEPAFQCSLMVGWGSPHYFEQEWRTTYVMLGHRASLATGDLLAGADKGRITGGKVEDLEPYGDVSADRLHDFRALGTQEHEFARVFTEDLMETFFSLASTTHPYELNVTPSSVNIYTTYCDAEAQQANVKFLEELAARLEVTSKS